MSALSMWPFSRKPSCPCPPMALRRASPSTAAQSPCPPPPPLRVEDQLFKVPVLAAFVFNAQYGWYPFGLCKESGKCLASDDTSQTSEMIFLLGLLVVTLKMRMWPRKAWTRPPNPIFMAYKFFVTLFLLEFGMRCLWRPLERFLHVEIPKFCDNALASQSAYGCDLKSFCMEPVCSMMLQPYFSQFLSFSVASIFLWSTLSSARFLTMDQLRNHFLLTFSALTTVALQFYSNNRCIPNSDIFSDGKVGSPFWMQ